MSYVTKNYKVHWKYDPIKHEMHCLIDHINGNNIVRDKIKVEKFIKAIARKDSLERAMQVANLKRLLDKQSRREIWEEFNNFTI